MPIDSNHGIYREHIFNVRVASDFPPIATGSTCWGNRRFGPKRTHAPQQQHLYPIMSAAGEKIKGA
jgi:hypothetical protein